MGSINKSYLNPSDILKYNGHDWSDPDPVTKARKCNYCGKVNIKFKKAKNAYKYKIEKRPGSGTTMNDSWITTKTNNNYEMWFKGGTGKVTVKITPYSKEGIKGKTIKKTIRI
ncbi:MAG: hypothetical protein K6G76_02620 [Lachnospiraceae bacterium]|nr:hypothetical protein [Lachnospiraceae bacterium]